MSAIGVLTDFLTAIGRPPKKKTDSVDQSPISGKLGVPPELKGPGSITPDVPDNNAPLTASDMRQRGAVSPVGYSDDMTQTGAYRGQDTQAPSSMAVSPIKQTVDTIEAKQYQPGIYRNPQTGETTNNRNKPGFTEVVQAPGKDRSTNWTTKQKIGSTLLGVLQGAAGGPLGMLQGGLNAGMDRDYLQKYQDQKNLQNLMPKLKYQQDQEKMAQEAQQRDLQNQYLAVKPEVALQAADQKDQQIAQGSRRLDIAAEKNAADAEYKHNLLILGKTKADQINQYRQQILQLKQQGVDQNDQRIKILQQRADEAARHNKVAEGNQKTAETGRNNRAALRSAMASQLKILEEAGKTGRQTQAEEARRKLKELQDQYDANP